MVFFDLSILYRDPAALPSTKQAEAAKADRLKAVVKAMELGYSGVAYDRHISGFMSDHDRCKIAPFPLSSLVKVAPGLSASVRFHRELLGVPLSAPFRQYRRLTVAVESAAQAEALNAGNPILKTYDLVAVRPLSQSAFELACKRSEVHIITIDFSQKLPFRLKRQHSNVQDAIKRGVYFEICYSHLVDSTQSRRQMLPGAKILVECTRGKNIIFSSAATSADQIRGPCDVANVSSLLGLSIERAKASISRNCRSLLINAFRKRQFLAGAIKIEQITSKDRYKLDEECLDDWSSWDPISSGGGDLTPVADIDMLSSDIDKVPMKSFSTCLITTHDDLAVQNKSLTRMDSTDAFGSNRSLFSVSDKPYYLPAAASQSRENLGGTNHGFSFANWSADNEGSMFSVNDYVSKPVTEEGDMVDSDGTGITSIPLEVASLKDKSPESKVETIYLDSNLTLPTEYTPSEPVNSGSVVASGSVRDLFNCISLTSCIEEKHDEMAEDQFIDKCMEINQTPFSEDMTMPSNQNCILPSKNTKVGESILLSELPEKSNVTSIACNMPMDVCSYRVVSCEEPDVQRHTASHFLVEDRGVKGKGSVVLDTSKLERDGLLTSAIQEENIASLYEIQLHNHKSGKSKVIQKLKRRSYQLPFKNMFMPLLFKRKGQKRAASRKRHAG